MEVVLQLHVFCDVTSSNSVACDKGA